MLALMVSEGVVGPDAGLVELIVGVHALLTRSPSRVLLAALGDAVGDMRQPNMPGTVDEYPNWRLPVADGDGRLLTLDELCRAPGAARLAAVLQAGLSDNSPASGAGTVRNEDESE